MNKLFTIITTAAMCAALIFSGCTEERSNAITSSAIAAVSTVDIVESPICAENFKDIESDIPEEDRDESGLTQEEVELIALLTMAEAEDECEMGKRLVIDTVLNRVESEDFPDTVFGVIFQPYQFPSMTNGRADVCEVRPDICELVLEENEERTNSECIFFNSGGYCDWGKPLFRVQNHYFSGKEVKSNEE